MNNMQEVILVNEHDEPLGTMEKMEAHRRALLHRAFSVFIFNEEGDMLLQQRSWRKYHSGGLWTNACCSHPRPGEDTGGAAARRLQEEMGFSVPLQKIFEFTYRSPFENGLTEHEFDHVFAGIFNGIASPDEREVQDFRYMSIKQISDSIELHPDLYTSWFRIAFPMVKKWMEKDKSSL